jgi:hypothetical protein
LHNASLYSPSPRVPGRDPCLQYPTPGVTHQLDHPFTLRYHFRGQLAGGCSLGSFEKIPIVEVDSHPLSMWAKANNTFQYLTFQIHS